MMAANCILQLRSTNFAIDTKLLLNPDWNMLGKGWQGVSSLGNPLGLTGAGLIHKLPTMLVLFQQGRPVAYLDGFDVERANEGDAGRLRSASNGISCDYSVIAVDCLALADSLT